MENKQQNTPKHEEPKQPTILERKQAIAKQLESNLATCSPINRTRLLLDADNAMKVLEVEVMQTTLSKAYGELASSCSGKWLFNFDTDETSQQLVQFKIETSGSGGHRNGFINGNGKVNMEVKNRTVAITELNIPRLEGDSVEASIARAGYTFTKNPV